MSGSRSDNQPQSQPQTIGINFISDGTTLYKTVPTINHPVPLISPASPLAFVSTDTSKKRRGRPHGSLNKNHPKKRAYGSVRPSLTSHVLMVNAKENVLEKIMAFSQNLSGNISILSAIGAISKATICVAGNTVTHEGRYEIISLSGSLSLGGLNVTLSSDGGVFGGRVVDVLTAASPVQIVLGSFISWSQEEVETGPKEPPKEVPRNTPSSDGINILV